MLTQLEQNNYQAPGPSLRWVDSNELKGLVRDRLTAMGLQQREEFVQALELEMRKAGSTLRSHLLLIGIPAKCPDELTPNEVGHLIRYFNISEPELMPVVSRVISRFSLFPENDELPQLASGLIS